MQRSKRKLTEPPYLQVAFDTFDLESVKRTIPKLPLGAKILVEAGTPLIKKFGIGVIGEIKKVAKGSFIIADLKTLDVGEMEAGMAADAGADGAVVSGLAAIDTISGFISECDRKGIHSIIDMMNVKEQVKLLQSLKELPDVVILHKGIDTEKSSATHPFEILGEFKKNFKGRPLIAIAGGINPESAARAVKEGADILIVGRYIVNSNNLEKTVEEFIRIIR